MNLDKLSKYLLWVLMGISVVVVALFFIVGFDTPYEEDPNLNAPVFTDALLVWTIILTVAGGVCMLASFIYYVCENGVNSSYIYTWGLPVLTIVIGVILGISNKDDHMLINGQDWNNPVDIIITDASMVSIAVLTVCAIIAIIFSVIMNTKK